MLLSVTVLDRSEKTYSFLLLVGNGLSLPVNNARLGKMEKRKELGGMRWYM